MRNAASKAAVAATVPQIPKEEDKTVEFFRHLYKPRVTTISSMMKDIHPTVLALGLQMKNYTICGSCARLAATMQAFKQVRDLPNSILAISEVWKHGWLALLIAARSSNRTPHPKEPHSIDTLHLMYCHLKSTTFRPVDHSQYPWATQSGG